jgi:hypothetical protein
MRNVTHQFAHLETLERAKRWLIQAGIDASRIEARTQGILTLAVQVEAGEAAEVKQIIDAAEASDPDGNPGIWDLANRRYTAPQTGPAEATQHATHSESFVIGWRPQDGTGEVIQTDTEIQKDYREGKD